ncbi:MAG: BamA/TamA family outer membrane protein [candidate division WOR-3 bacterium]|nr:BamA/TamA family outer membrane protein [candidate division WOR-3 bacterium]
MKDINVEGNKYLSKKEILDILRLRKNQEFSKIKLKSAISRLYSKYYASGYFQVSINHEYEFVEASKVVITIKINEGKRALISNIEFDGDIILDSLIYIMPKKLPIAYSDEFINTIENKIYYLYYNNGYPFVRLERDTSFLNDSLLIFKEKIAAGKRILIKSIKIENNRSVRDGIFYKEITIRPNEYFNYDKISESSQRLYSLRLFSSVDYRIQDDSILIFSVNEVPQRYLETNAGFTYPYFLNLSILLGHLNIFGNAQNAEIELSGLFSYKNNRVLLNDRSFTINYRERYFLDRKNLLLSSNLIYNKYGQVGEFSDYGKIEEFSLFSEIIRQFSRYFYSAFGMSLKRSITLGYEESRFILSFSQRAFYDDRNNYLDATRGFNLSLSILEAFGQARFIKLSEIYSKYFYSFALRIRMGQIFGSNIPYSEKFFLGGEGSVRGYLNNSIGESFDNLQPASNHFINGNFEYRWRFNSIFAIVFFYDFAITSNEFLKLFNSKLYSGYGIGFRFYVNLIPLRFDIALNPNSKILPKDLFLYFGIGNMF